MGVCDKESEKYKGAEVLDILLCSSKFEYWNKQHGLKYKMRNGYNAIMTHSVIMWRILAVRKRFWIVPVGERGS